MTNQKRQLPLSRWVSLVERQVSHGNEVATYHSLAQGDYVSILALTENQEALLVEQYRPAVDRMTLELPAGLLREGEDPAQCAVRELYEETGHRTGSAPLLLGKWHPDTGRLENMLWAYFVSNARPDPHWEAELGVDNENGIKDAHARLAEEAQELKLSVMTPEELNEFIATLDREVNEEVEL